MPKRRSIVRMKPAQRSARAGTRASSPLPVRGRPPEAPHSSRFARRLATASLAIAAIAFAADSFAQGQGSRYTFAGAVDWDRDGHQDIVARDPAGVLWLYPGSSVRAYSTVERVQIGNGWNGYRFAGLADWDRDGHPDIVARDASGTLWLYPGASTRGYSKVDRVQIGNDWNGYTFAGLADWDRDGHQDIVATDTAGVLWLYPGMSARGYSTAERVQIGNGWGGYMFAGLVDWDRDGHQDIVARDAAGLLWLYPGASTRGYSGVDRVQIGNGWGGYAFAGLTDWDRDGHQDIVARDSAGLLWLYPGMSTRGYSTAERIQIGHGW